MDASSEEEDARPKDTTFLAELHALKHDLE